MSGLLVALQLMKDVLSFVITMPGALSVMTSGAHLMLMLSVDKLAIRIKVRINNVMYMYVTLILTIPNLL